MLSKRSPRGDLFRVLRTLEMTSTMLVMCTMFPILPQGFLKAGPAGAPRVPEERPYNGSYNGSCDGSCDGDGSTEYRTVAVGTGD
ncbi:MAG: hypothetical protein CMN76_13830 [Spirochaetaceae bacterium]|nr:hypothetical protein [Spirochaetaceae bacterium]